MKARITLLILQILFVAIAHAQEPHHGALASNGSVFFRAEPLNNYLTDRSDELYYYVHLQGVQKTLTSVKERLPLNLSIVMDRSGSMEGDKLNYAKDALKYVVNQLDKDDVLSIVLYETGVEVFLEPQHIEDKAGLLKRIDEIKTAGSTNIEGGIKKGYSLIKQTKKLVTTEMVNRVLLLSDGIANVGITDTEALSAITRNYFEEDKISISTFGVGTDYNENLMSKIALQGGGLYYFINSPEKLPELFNEELKGMSKVIAQNTVLKIKFPEEHLSYQRTYAFNSNLKGNVLEINFGDLFEDEQKSILICFKTKGKIKTPLNIECSLEYKNANQDPMLAVVDNRKSEIKMAANEAEYKKGYNKSASEGYALEVSQELYDKAVDYANAEQFSNAKVKVKEALVLLDNHFTSVGENTFLRELYKKLNEYDLLIDNMKNMDRETFKYNIKLVQFDGARRKFRSKF